MNHKKIIYIILGILLMPSFAFADLWYPASNNLRPVTNTFGLQVPSLGTGGNPCLTVSGTGVVSTQSCAGTGTNYLTNSSSNTYLNTGSNLQAPTLNATSTTGTSLFSGGLVAGFTPQLYVSSTTNFLGLGGSNKPINAGNIIEVRPLSGNQITDLVRPTGGDYNIFRFLNTATPGDFGWNMGIDPFTDAFHIKSDTNSSGISFTKSNGGATLTGTTRNFTAGTLNLNNAVNGVTATLNGDGGMNIAPTGAAYVDNTMNLGNYTGGFASFATYSPSDSPGCLAPNCARAFTYGFAPQTTSGSGAYNNIGYSGLSPITADFTTSAVDPPGYVIAQEQRGLLGYFAHPLQIFWGNGMDATSSVSYYPHGRGQGDMEFFTYNKDVSVGRSLLYMNALTGKVGIGTTTPIAALSVNLTNFPEASTTQYLLTVGTSTGNGIATTTVFAMTIAAGGNATTTVSGLNIAGSATSTSNVGFNITTGCYAISGTCVGGSGGSGTVNSGTTGQNAYYASNGTAVSGTSTIFTTTASNVGIGTTNPTEVNANARLTVAGISSQDIIASTTDNTTLSDAIIQAYAPGSRVFMGAHGTNQVSTRYGITLGGWGELGAFNSTSGTTNGLIIGTNPNVPVVFGTNNLERARITGAGGVAIGTTTPVTNVKLHITGNGSLADQLLLEDTSASANQHMTSFGNVNGSLVYNTMLDNNATTTRFRIGSTGKVGIATTTDGPATFNVTGSGYISGNLNVGNAIISANQVTSNYYTMGGCSGGYLVDMSNNLTMCPGTQFFDSAGAQGSSGQLLTISGGIPIWKTLGTIAISGGGTGTTTAPVSQLLYGGSGGVYQSVATSSASCASGVSCSSFTVVGTVSPSVTLNLASANNFTANQTAPQLGAGTSTPWAILSAAKPVWSTTPFVNIGSTTASGTATTTLFHIDQNGLVYFGTSSVASISSGMDIQNVTNATNILALHGNTGTLQFNITNAGVVTTGGNFTSGGTINGGATTLTGTAAANVPLTIRGRQNSAPQTGDLFDVQGNTATVLANIKAQGQFGLGTTTPWAMLSVSTTTADSPILPYLAIGANSGTSYMVVSSTGNTGIATTSPWLQFSTNGRVAMAGLTASSGLQTGILCLSSNNEVINESVACVASSKRFKEKISDLNVGLDEVMQMRPVEFNYTKEFNGSLKDNPNYNGQQVGFIAEEIQKIDPRLIVTDQKGLPYSVRYENMTAVLAQAIKDQQGEIEKLKSSSGNSNGGSNNYGLFGLFGLLGLIPLFKKR